MSKKVFVKTFGCQMNVYDSDKIIDVLKVIGYEKSENLNSADCFVLNTCHIRDKAKEKVYHEIGRVRETFLNKTKPLVIIAGCVAQAENTEMLKREPYIDLVIGPQSYHKLNETILKFEENKSKNEITDFDTLEKFNYLSKLQNNNSKVSSFLTIQEGCDKFCHFCVVPYTRGPEFSRPYNQILNEAKKIAKNGSKEIILLGQNVNAYNYKDVNNKFRLSDLIMSLEEVNGIERIRYTTSHPRDMTKDLLECYKNSKKLMPLVHLPIQSGSNKILKLMNRKHKVDDYISTFNYLKEVNEKIEFSSDFIIGYPGEEIEDFENTIKLIDMIKFINSYSFIFSARPGTTASKLKIIDDKISKERLKIIQEKLFGYQKLKNESLEGKYIDVLVENEIKDQNKLFGRNEYMNSVILEGNKNLIGKIVQVRITKTNHKTLFGELSKKNKFEAA